MRCESLLHIAQEEFQAYASHCCFYPSFSPWSFANVLFSSTTPTFTPRTIRSKGVVAVCEVTVFKVVFVQYGCLYHTILETLSIEVAHLLRTSGATGRDTPKAETSQAEPARSTVKSIASTLSSNVGWPDHRGNKG